MFINPEADHWEKWEKWASWNDCGTNGCSHPDCHYHNPLQKEFEEPDSEEDLDRFDASLFEDPEDLDPPIEFLDKFGDPPLCLECSEDGSTVYWGSPAGGGVCKCSPFYPDLRPNDLPSWILEFRECSCERKYRVVGSVICKCNSPDLYALMERLHELELTDNFELVFPDQIDGDTPFYPDQIDGDIPF